MKFLNWIESRIVWSYLLNCCVMKNENEIVVNRSVYILHRFLLMIIPIYSTYITYVFHWWTFIVWITVAQALEMNFEVLNLCQFTCVQSVFKNIAVTAWCVQPWFTGWPQKFGTFLCAVKLHQILTNFQTFFTVRNRRKFVIILSLKIPPYLKHVATQSREMSVLKATTENKNFCNNVF